MNQLSLQAQVIERSVIRYTPAGVPVATVVLAYAGEVMEAGVIRTVSLEINAVALGQLSSGLQSLNPEQVALFSGFLARKNRNSKSLVFHITDIKPI